MARYKINLFQITGYLKRFVSIDFHANYMRINEIKENFYSGIILCRDCQKMILIGINQRSGKKNQYNLIFYFTDHKKYICTE